jgi:hypothetical protein
MRRKGAELVRPCLGAIVIGTLFLALDIDAQNLATCVEWGEAQTPPELGFNSRLLRENTEENCQMPEPVWWRYDWTSTDLRRDVSDLNPNILRFPGGTAGNYWWWATQSREIVGDDGQLRTLDICEANSIGLAISRTIGCPGPNEDFTADRYDDIKRPTTVTLQSYKEAVEHFREDGLNIQEMFMISLLDPFYYVGSPQLEYEAPSGSYEDIREVLFNASINRAMVQLDKIMDVYCDGCASIDDAFNIELGNEVFMKRYGKFFPSPECLEGGSICNDCHPDVELYADICEVLIPIVRERFPNAEIAIVGNRDRWENPWNQVLIDRFETGDITADAAVFHFYPMSIQLDEISVGPCKGIPGTFDPDHVLHKQQADMRVDFTTNNIEAFAETDMDIWITEFNNYDISEECFAMDPDAFEEDDFQFDAGNWIHALGIFNMYNEFIGYSSTANDPWMNSSKGLNVNKLCMQIMYGNDRVAAIRQDKQLSAQGMAIETLMHLNNEASSVKRLLIGPTGNFTFNALGEWSPAANLNNPLPYHINVDIEDDDGSIQSMPTWDAYGFLFEMPDGPKAIIINLKPEAIQLNMSHVTGFEEGASCLMRHVEYSKIHETLEAEYASPQIQNQNMEGDAQSLTIPAYSVSIVEGIPWTATGTEDREALSAEEIILYPNPSNTELQVSINPSYGNYRMRLIDITGQMLDEQIAYNQTSTFDTNVLAPGLYFVEVRSGLQTIMKPFIVQH